MKKINIFIKFKKKEQLLGQLVLDNRVVLFKYDRTYLVSGYNISPLKLKFDDRIQVCENQIFNGLFGVFADSLPDAWGQLVWRKHLSTQGIALETLSSLDKLSFVGENGLGALIYRPAYVDNQPVEPVILDSIDRNIKEILKGESSTIIDSLFLKGGSPGGARPKIYIGYNSKTDALVYGNTVLEKDYEHWILKFGANIDSPEMANIEMAYYYMALDAGLTMSESKLFVGKSGKKYFGTKRFDRINNKRLHMLSVSALVNDDYERSQLDYGTLMQIGKELTKTAHTHEQILRQAAFNIFAHNRDDHSKNFAFLMDEFGVWKFAPSYDLTFSSSSQGQHSTTCAGNGINPNTKELMELATHFSIKNGEEIITKVKETIANWNFYANKAGVSKTTQKVIGKVLKSLIEL